MGTEQRMTEQRTTEQRTIEQGTTGQGTTAERIERRPTAEAAPVQEFDVVHAVLSEEPISVDVAIAAVESETAGAVVSFSGVVRNHDGGKSVERLNYTAHPTAHRVLADVVAKLVAEHSGDDSGEPGTPVRIWAAHRVGALKIGDPALVCAVAAAHRGQAFAVCSELVDRIKEQVPIWKEQFFTDGTVEWVGAGA